MRSFAKLALFLIPAFMILNGCDLGGGQQYDPSEYTNVYMPQAQTATAERSFPIVDSVQTITYNAAYGGAITPEEDIPVRFSVEPALVDSFNTENATSYQILPEGSYRLTQETATIPAGERSTGQLGIELTTQGFLEEATQYLLPVRMEVEKEGVRVNEDKQVAYFLVEGNYLEIAKSDWEIVDFDSQQPGRADRAATLTIDGDPSTFWHTPWCCAAEEYGANRPGPPHWVTVDMGEVNNVHGFEVIGRDANYINNPKQVTLQFANEYNGEDTNWRDAEEFTLPFDANGATIQDRIYLDSTVEARYFKFTVTQSVGGPDRALTSLSEIIAF